MRALSPISGIGLLLLAACGGASAPAPSTSPAPPSAAGSPASKPSAAASAPAAASKPAGSAAASAAGKPGLETVHSGYVSVSAYSTVPTITKSLGFFEKHGIDAQLTFIAPAAMTAALLAGKDMDIGYGSGESTATVDAQGGDLVIVGALQQGGIFKISANPPVKSIPDLKGKTVAITSTGATTDLLLRQLLQQNNMVPNKDVTIVSIPDQPTMVAALKTGQVAAAVMSEPATTMAVAQGATVIYDQGKSGEKFDQLPVLVKRSYVAAHRDQVKRFLMATMEAVHMIKTQPAKAAPAAAAFLKNDDQAIVQKALEAVAQVSDDDLNVPVEAVAENIKTAAASLPDAAKLKPADIMDTSLLQEIKASGFIDSLGK
ncbi:MAG TPA: ABC transporter substrate-binding protein [Chloroflexota bacterium]|nr:ABC transporter substrate-binding protein [Chloroflexota bacterium]